VLAAACAGIIGQCECLFSRTALLCPRIAFQLLKRFWLPLKWWWLWFGASLRWRPRRGRAPHFPFPRRLLLLSLWFVVWLLGRSCCFETSRSFANVPHERRRSTRATPFPGWLLAAAICLIFTTAASISVVLELLPDGPLVCAGRRGVFFGMRKQRSCRSRSCPGGPGHARQRRVSALRLASTGGARLDGGIGVDCAGMPRPREPLRHCALLLREGGGQHRQSYCFSQVAVRTKPDSCTRGRVILRSLANGRAMSCKLLANLHHKKDMAFEGTEERRKLEKNQRCNEDKVCFKRSWIQSSHIH